MARAESVQNIRMNTSTRFNYSFKGSMLQVLFIAGSFEIPIMQKVSIAGPKTINIYSTTIATKNSNQGEYSSKIIRAKVNKKQMAEALIAYAVKTTRISI